MKTEDQILLYIARPSLDPAATLHLGELVEQEIDCRVLLAEANDHGLLPFLRRHLSVLPSNSVCAEVSAELADQDRRNTNANLFLTGELVKVITLLNKEKVTAVPFKGPVLSLLAHSDPGLRQFSDLDLLIRRADYFVVKKQLATLGFTPSCELTLQQELALLRFGCAANFQNQEGVVLDVHWNFTERYLNFQINVESVWDRLQILELGGGKVPTLAPEDLLIVLCLHGFTHCWERLGWLTDLAALINRTATLDWTPIYARAREYRVERLVSLGLFLVWKVLDTSLPSQIQERLLADRELPKWADEYKAHLFLSKPARELLDPAMMHLRLTQSATDKLNTTFNLLATPRSFDWMFLPLPDYLFFLYYPLRPLRIAGKYGWKLLRPAGDSR